MHLRPPPTRTLLHAPARRARNSPTERSFPSTTLSSRKKGSHRQQALRHLLWAVQHHAERAPDGAEIAKHVVNDGLMLSGSDVGFAGNGGHARHGLQLLSRRTWVLEATERASLITALSKSICAGLAHAIIEGDRPREAALIAPEPGADMTHVSRRCTLGRNGHGALHCRPGRRGIRLGGKSRAQRNPFIAGPTRIRGGQCRQPRPARTP